MTEQSKIPKSDLELAVKALTKKTAPYKALFGYYDGDQKLKYNTERLRDIFKELSFDFTENWCAVVIDSTANRVNLKSFIVKSEEKKKPKLLKAVERVAQRAGLKAPPAQATLNEIVDRNRLILESDDVHEVAMVIGESFYYVWPDADGKAEGFYNDPRLVHLFYEEEHPRKKKFAAKWWRTFDKRTRLVLYYPDRFEYYSTKPMKKSSEIKAEAFEPTDDEGQPLGEGVEKFENEYGEVPWFHFRPELRKIKSDLKNVIGPQDAINKLLADLIVTSEFSAYPQRYIISSADSDTKLKNAPYLVWDLAAGIGDDQPTVVGSLPTSDPKAYLDPVNREVRAIGAITQTPNHLLMETASTQISGEALIVLESPINKKAQNRIDLFSPVWAEVAVFMLLIEGVKNMKPSDISPIFDDPATVQPKTRAEITQINVNSGIALTTELKRSGWSEAEIDDMLIEKKEEQMARQQSMAAAMLESRRKFDNPELGDGLDDE